MSVRAMAQRESRTDGPKDRGWRLPTLVLVGTLAFSSWVTQESTTGALWAGDDDVDAQEEAAESLYTVFAEVEGSEQALVLWDDATVRLETGEPYGTWNLALESDDFTIATNSFSLELIGMAQSLEGGSGAATLTTEGGDTFDGTWALADIHPVEVGDLLYNLEFVDDTVLTGTFTSILVEGEWRDISVGEGNTVEIVGPFGSEIVHLSDGCEVFVGNGDNAPFALVIQDPQKKLRKREPRKPGQQGPVSAPRLYAKGAWVEVTQSKKGCFNNVPTGGNCGVAVGECKLVVTMILPTGKQLALSHTGVCGNAANSYTVNDTGSLWVNF